MKERIEEAKRSSAGPFIGLVSVLAVVAVFIAFLACITFLVSFVME